jgi:GH24 family phage-related lysozyme (muramidase)
MQISANGLRLIREEEGFIGCPYWDSAGGKWTRGVGETEGISRDSRCITEAEGLANVKRIFADRYAWALDGLKLNQNQYDALADFIWNCGPGAIGWGVGNYIKQDRYGEAANLLLRFDTAQGVPLADLARRRARERALFLAPVKPIKPKNPLDVLYPAERRVVNSYLSYIKHPRLHPHGLKVTREQMTQMRKNIYDASVYGSLENGTKVKKGWNINNRKSRYELLKRYTA